MEEREVGLAFVPVSAPDDPCLSDNGLHAGKVIEDEAGLLVGDAMGGSEEITARIDGRGASKTRAFRDLQSAGLPFVRRELAVRNEIGDPRTEIFLHLDIADAFVGVRGEGIGTNFRVLAVGATGGKKQRDGRDEKKAMLHGTDDGGWMIAVHEQLFNPERGKRLDAMKAVMQPVSGYLDDGE